MMELSEPGHDRPDDVLDVVVIGAGLAGTSASLALALAGRKVALVDPHAVYPSEFRAEKLDTGHMAVFAELGLGPAVEAVLTPMDDAWIYRFGKLFARERQREYGFAYDGLVNGLRAALPSSVDFRIGKVAEVAAGPDLQRVVLTDGTVFTARLIVVATGLGNKVRASLGIKRVETSKGHSLSLGFTFRQPARAFPFDTLTFYGDTLSDRVAYLTTFPIGDRMRANFFVYRTVADDWTKDFRRRPQEMLCELLPSIADICDGFALDGPVDVRQIDLMVTEGYRRDGVVLLGDAFCTTCPAPGVGIRRVMTDVKQLCSHHLPDWLVTPGMGADKIARFYDDPVKQAVDARGIALSYYARSIVVDSGPIWVARRLRNNAVRRVLSWAGGAGHGLLTRMSGPSMGTGGFGQSRR